MLYLPIFTSLLIALTFFSVEGRKLGSRSRDEICSKLGKKGENDDDMTILNGEDGRLESSDELTQEVLDELSKALHLTKKIEQRELQSRCRKQRRRRKKHRKSAGSNEDDDDGPAPRILGDASDDKNVSAPAEVEKRIDNDWARLGRHKLDPPPYIGQRMLPQTNGKRRKGQTNKNVNVNENQVVLSEWKDEKRENAKKSGSREDTSLAEEGDNILRDTVNARNPSDKDKPKEPVNSSGSDDEDAEKSGDQVNSSERDAEVDEKLENLVDFSSIQEAENSVMKIMGKDRTTQALAKSTKPQDTLTTDKSIDNDSGNKRPAGKRPQKSKDRKRERKDSKRRQKSKSKKGRHSQRHSQKRTINPKEGDNRTVLILKLLQVYLGGRPIAGRLVQLQGLLQHLSEQEKEQILQKLVKDIKTKNKTKVERTDVNVSAEAKEGTEAARSEETSNHEVIKSSGEDDGTGIAKANEILKARESRYKGHTESSTEVESEVTKNVEEKPADDDLPAATSTEGQTDDLANAKVTSTNNDESSSSTGSSNDSEGREVIVADGQQAEAQKTRAVLPPKRVSGKGRGGAATNINSNVNVNQVVSEDAKKDEEQRDASGRRSYGGRLRKNRRLRKKKKNRNVNRNINTNVNIIDAPSSSGEKKSVYTRRSAAAIEDRNKNVNVNSNTNTLENVKEPKVEEVAPAEETRRGRFGGGRFGRRPSHRPAHGHHPHHKNIGHIVDGIADVVAATQQNSGTEEYDPGVIPLYDEVDSGYNDEYYDD